CIIVPVLTVFMAKIPLQLDTEVRYFAPIMQFLLNFHREKTAVHPFLQTVRQKSGLTYINNVYFRKKRAGMVEDKPVMTTKDNT
ncbi:MAG: hypothetical protein K2H10_04500, partial [Bacteroidales bacterium]|nr:hypothetical protein [Bacteroidales bacterium]